MKKFIYLFGITLLMLQSCSTGDSSSDTTTTTTTTTTSGNVDYEFTITFDEIVYKVKGNTGKDAGYSGPTINNCFAKGAKYIDFSIKDVTYYNYVSGKPIECFLSLPSNFTSGINMMSMQLSFNGVSNYSYYKNEGACPGCNGGGDNSLPINITDLGTPLTGKIGTSNVIFGNTIKGSYTGVVYTVPSGSNNATTPHNLSIDFKAVRQY
jgi:hypothetical protein